MATDVPRSVFTASLTSSRNVHESFISWWFGELELSLKDVFWRSHWGLQNDWRCWQLALYGTRSCEAMDPPVNNKEGCFLPQGLKGLVWLKELHNIEHAIMIVTNAIRMVMITLSWHYAVTVVFLHEDWIPLWACFADFSLVFLARHQTYNDAWITQRGLDIP